MKVKHVNDELCATMEFVVGKGRYDVTLAYLSEEELDGLTEMCQKITYKDHQPVKAIDNRKFKEKLVGRTLKNIRRAKYENVYDFIEPNVVLDYGTADTSQEMKFNDDLLEIIVHHINADFYEFVSAGCRKFNLFQLAVKAQEEENLKRGSGTAKASASSAIKS